MEATITLLKGDKKGSETDYRDALPVNMSGVLRPMFGAQGYMLQQPGLVKYGNGIGIDRGALWNERHNEHYRVSGDSFIKVDANGSSTVLGTVSGLDTASLPYSFNTQGVLVDGRFWLYDKSGGTFTEVTDPDLGDPIDASWIDGYYIFTDGEYIYHTDIASETSIDPLKYATAEFSPDATLGVAKTSDNKFRAFGRYTIEDFVNQANENFAFTRLTGRAIPRGIVGTHCKCEVNEKWYIMGGGKKEAVSIFVLGVGSSGKIASREIDKIIGQYTEAELADSVLEARGEDDYSYLIVHLPNETLLYNVNIGEAFGPDQAWSLLKSDVLGNTPWRGKFGLFEPRLGKWVYGDRQTSDLGILEESVPTHYGELVEWELHTPAMQLESMSIDELEIETIPGFSPTKEYTYSIPGNLFTYSERFDIGWTGSAGVSGKVVSDTDNALFEFLGKSLSITTITDPYTASIEVEKDSDTSRVCMLRLEFSGSSTEYHDIQLNTQAGTIFQAGSGANLGYGVVDNGTTWRIYIGAKSVDSLNTTVSAYLFPAVAGSLGNYDPTATGSITMVNHQIAITDELTDYVKTEDEPITTANGIDDTPDSVFISLTYDGVSHSSEYTQAYGVASSYGMRFIARQLGYIPNWVSIKLRGASLTRMAFSRAKINYG